MLTMDILIIFLTVVLVCTYSIAHRSDNPQGKGGFMSGGADWLMSGDWSIFVKLI